MVTTLSADDLIDMYETMWKSTKVGDLWISNEFWCEGENRYYLITKMGHTDAKGWHPNTAYWVEMLSLTTMQIISITAYEFEGFERVANETDR